MRKLHFVPMAVSTVVGASLLAACDDVAAIRSTPIGPQPAATQQAAPLLGQLRFSITIPDASRQVAALMDRVERIELRVTGTELSQSLGGTITKADITNGSATKTFASVPVGDVTISATVYDAAGAKTGAGTATATVVANQTTTAQMTVYVTPVGGLGTNISLVEQPLSASKLGGRLAFSLAPDGASPGTQLTVGLKRKLASETSYAKIDTTTTTDTAGNFLFSGLNTGSYQCVYDNPSTFDSGYSTVGVGVSDPVAVTDIQSTAPSANMDLAWDFMASSVSPKPNSSLASRTGVTFTWPVKAGVTDPVYQFVIFTSSNTSSGALLASATTSATTLTLSLTSAVSAGTRYVLYRYWKSGGSFNGANYYGQSKPIPIIVP